MSQSEKKALVMLEDGTKWFGYSVYGEGTAFGEICFNTGMTGYQEIFTDPSYFGQIMVTSNSHIGNYGTLNTDNQSDSIKISGLICRNFSYHYSRKSADDSLLYFIKNKKLFAVKDVDTRSLVRHIRDKGVMNAVISTRINEKEYLKEALSNVPKMDGLELASKVSTKKAYTLGREQASLRVAVIDLGIKKNILNELLNRDVFLKIFPYDVDYSTIKKWNPDGYFISNGPGDPRPLTQTQVLAKQIYADGNLIFGICLGHQIIALANGIKTYKMHNGHRGINHPVKNILTSKGEITSQNHGFAIDINDTKSNSDFEISHIHLNDNTVAGIRNKNGTCFSIQYHPEAGPGTNDTTYLFDEFIHKLKQNQS